jgi:aryl-phospho-beta-D-glucosidase BglC (GH1 family)
MDSNGKVDDAWMKRVHEVVDYVLDAGMYCILNVHHDTGAGNTAWLIADETVYNNTKERYENLWKQIAVEFKDYGERLLFESYNEMLDSKRSWCFSSFNTTNRYDAAIAKSAYSAINSYAQSFVNVVRATGGNNACRNLVVNTYGACSGSGTWNTHLTDPLKEMKLPQDNAQNHLIFEIHSYLDVTNLSNVKKEVDDMITKLNNHLVSKGAPVIFGEWGTSNVDAGTDYIDRRENMIAFMRYFIEKCKENHIGTFYWMGLSDGMPRSLPAFQQPDLVEAMTQAFYGDSFQAIIPTVDDYELSYTVNYNGQCQELNLVNSEIVTNDYQSVTVELGEVPANDLLQVKVYGASDGKETYQPVSSSSLSTTVTFDASKLGTKIRRVTLQYTKSQAYAIGVKRVILTKKDGTEQEMTPSVFWGCSLSVEARRKATGIVSPVWNAVDDHVDGNVYNLSGQRVAHPSKGIYIYKGRKYVVR